MSHHRRLSVSEVGDVTIVRFVDRKILDAIAIEELGDELVSLVEVDNRKRLLLNFADVTFMSSAALNKLIVLEKRVRQHTGRLKLCSLRPELNEIFEITRLNRLFEITESESEALATF
jgi:anti-sigma B factor antagonist